MIDQSSANQEPQGVSKRILPPEPFGERLAAVRAHRNPLPEAARPLLRAQADMPEYLDTDAIPVLRTLLEQEMQHIPEAV